jgi:hypothetical protein
MTEDVVSQEEFERFLKDRFASGSEATGDHVIVDAVEDLVSKHQKDSIGTFLLDAAMMIARLFEFKEVSFGLKDTADGRFKYAVTLGFLPATQEAMRKTVYTIEDMNDHTNYRDIKLGRISELVIDSPEQELRTFNRPALVHKKRSSIDEFLEGDYIDIYLYGTAEEMIGWLELAGPKSGKIPGADTIRWLELIVSIIGRITWERMYSQSHQKGQLF